MYSYGPPHMAGQKQDDQLEHTFNSYMKIQDVALKTCQRRWTIGRSGERGSGISVLTAWHDDDDDMNKNKSRCLKENVSDSIPTTMIPTYNYTTKHYRFHGMFKIKVRIYWIPKRISLRSLWKWAVVRDKTIISRVSLE